MAGIASSLITDQSPKDAPIVVTCDGPCTRIYCLYDEDAIDGDEASEESLGFDPLKGDWTMSLPCPTDELDWVRAALKKHSSRITARDHSTGFAIEEASAVATSTLTLDVEGFLKP